MAEPLLKVDNLTMHYITRGGEVSAVDGVSFSLGEGEALGLVSESGCGKTSMASAILRLLPDNVRLQGGRVCLGGLDLTALSEEEMRQVRWRRIAMVFQAAMNSLNPVYSVGDQIIEAIHTHIAVMSNEQARQRVAELFERVGLDRKG